MAFGVFEIDPEIVIESPEFPDTSEDNFVFEHLKRYCSKFEPLPAITVRLESSKLIVTEGHKYCRMARELGRKAIRAIAHDCTVDDLKKSGISARELDLSTLHAEHAALTFSDSWHVIFVRNPLGYETARSVEAQIESFVENYMATQHHIENAFQSGGYDVDGRCLEFSFVTPTHDKQWADGFLQLLVTIADQIGGIESYQGLRFEHSVTPQKTD
ncbi:MAG: hypothetical protein AAGK14_14745 [Verrucomicrobiota bacterium]